MSLLLSVETSTQFCSVALHKEGKLLSSRFLETPRSAASQLAVMIEECIADAKVVANDLCGVIVASGPGSYTGLRIGVATAKGLAYSLDIPLISVNTLELMTYQFKHESFSQESSNLVLLCPMLDARRMEVYCAVFDQQMNYIEPIQAKIIDEESFCSLLEKNQIIFFGEGADKCKSVIHHPNAKFNSHLIPQAAYLGEIGFKKYCNSSFEDIVTFEPFYLKDFLIKKPNLS